MNGFATASLGMRVSRWWGGHRTTGIVLYYTHAEAEALLARAGLTDIRSTWVNENSWSVIGRKPEG